MKLRAVLVGIGLMVGSMAFAQENPVEPDAPTPTPTPTPTPKPMSAAKKAPTPTPTPKKREEPKIEGTIVSRPGGNLIGFNFVGNNIVLTFYDAKKKRMNVDVNSAVVRWEMKRKNGDDRASFSPGSDAFTLISPKSVPPPHNIRFTLLLFKQGSDQAVETYVVTPAG